MEIYLDIARTVVLFLFLIIATIYDVRSRSIPWILYAVFGIAGIAWFVAAGEGNVWDEAFGVLLGAVFIGIAMISSGKFGMGDGLAILVVGIYLGGGRAAESMLYAMIVSTIASIIILALRKGNRNTALPFLPFMLTGCLMQGIGGIV